MLSVYPSYSLIRIDAAKPREYSAQELKSRRYKLWHFGKRLRIAFQSPPSVDCSVLVLAFLCKKLCQHRVHFE